MTRSPKITGGSSVINGMMYMRGHAADYDAWAIDGATGWSWYDVLPFFLKSEDNREIGNGVSSQYHNTGGPLPVQKVVKMFPLNCLLSILSYRVEVVNCL